MTWFVIIIDRKYDRIVVCHDRHDKSQEIFHAAVEPLFMGVYSDIVRQKRLGLMLDWSAKSTLWGVRQL